MADGQVCDTKVVRPDLLHKRADDIHTSSERVGFKMKEEGERRGHREKEKGGKEGWKELLFNRMSTIVQRSERS